MQNLGQSCNFFVLVIICLGGSYASAPGETAKSGTQQQTKERKIALVKDKDASSAREVLAAIKSANVNEVPSSLLATSDLRSAIALGKGDAGLRLAIERLLTPPLFRKGQSTNNLTVIRNLVATLAGHPNADYRVTLQNVYVTAYDSAENLQQLDQAKQLAQLLHPVMKEWGVVQEAEFSRSGTYKKFVRKQRLLADAKK